MTSIALFNRNLNDPSPSGIKTFLVEVLSRLMQMDDLRFTLVALDERSATHLHQLFPQGQRRIAVLPWGLWPTRIAWLMGFRNLSRALGPHDVYWSAVPWPYGASDRPLLVTVHDFFPLLRFHAVSPSWRRRVQSAFYARGVYSSCRRSACIVSISSETRRQVESRKLDRGTRSTTISHGVDLERWRAPAGLSSEELRNSLGLPKNGPIFATAGAHEPHKNHARLVEAFASTVSPVHPEACLVLAGGEGSETGRLRGLLRERKLVGRVFIPGALPSHEVHALIKHASAFVFPSLLEGFGLPILEAFAAGTPVIGSEVDVVKEVAGDAALLVDPYAPQALGEAMLRILRDHQLRAELVERGARRAEASSWESAALRYAEIIRQLADRARDLHSPRSARANEEESENALWDKHNVSCS